MVSLSNHELLNAILSGVEGNVTLSLSKGDKWLA
jgi:hypothetical protein